MNDVRLFIDGVWCEGSLGQSGEVINPSTGIGMMRVAHATASDVARAISAAQRALPVWRIVDGAYRAGILRKAAVLLQSRVELVARALTLEQGKTLAESRAELARAIDTLSWCADASIIACESRGNGTSSAVIMPEPIGVVGAFTPWNYPAVIIARKLGAALAAGCPVVLKAAEETPCTAAHIVAALEDAGIPNGVVNLVFGDPPEISAQMLESPVVRAFSFTGSTAVGKQLGARAARTLKRCVLELGGHAPVLVFADANIEAAVHSIAAYKFECAGQSCNAPSRIYVQAPIYAHFVDAFGKVARNLRVGDGLDPMTDVGPMANARRLVAMKRLTDDALMRGASRITGGDRAKGAGYFWSPTVLADVPDSAMLASEEPFGPLAPISSFSTFDEVITRANSTSYGLAAYVFTGSEDTAGQAARELAMGSVGINELKGVPPEVGIAGIKDSGYGYEGGHAGIDAFLNLKVVSGSSARLRQPVSHHR